MQRRTAEPIAVIASEQRSIARTRVRIGEPLNASGTSRLTAFDA